MLEKLETQGKKDEDSKKMIMESDIYRINPGLICPLKRIALTLPTIKNESASKGIFLRLKLNFF